jgi:hypothetical protein
MERDDLALYLVLAPEFGGARFGPYEGLEVRLGSDSQRCNVVVSETLGVLREHCKLLRQGDGAFLLSPSERTAAVFLWKGDARRPTQVTAPTAVRPGDSFAMVSPDGYRFVIELAPLPPEVLAKRRPVSSRGPRGLSAKKFRDEGWRMVLARLWTMGPVALATRAWYMVQSGAIWEPRILIPATLALFAMVGMAGSCGTAFKFRRDKVRASDKLAQCNENLAFANQFADRSAESLKFHELVSVVTGNLPLGQALGSDNDLRPKVKQAAARIADAVSDGGSEDWRWLIEDSQGASEFAALRERLAEAKGLDPGTAGLLPYTAFGPRMRLGDWSRVTTSTDEDGCGRGPLALTYRQARSLGLQSVQLDAYVAAGEGALRNDEAQRAQAILATATAAREAPPTPMPPTEIATLAAGVENCIYAAGPDDRESPSKVLAAVTEHLGKDAGALPGLDEPAASVSRVAKLFAADVQGNNYAAGASLFKFGRALSQSLAERAGAGFVLDRTAITIARATVLPCYARLKAEDPGKMEKVLGKLPPAVPCLVLMWDLRDASGG